VREIARRSRATVPVSPSCSATCATRSPGVTQPGGTARGAFAGSPVAVAGKTGTGEVANQQDTSWFASFAPVADPELVVVGVVSQGGTGGTVAAPAGARGLRRHLRPRGRLAGRGCRGAPTAPWRRR
jgi:penicillin-binding protein 2